MNLFYQPDLDHGNFALDAEESRHAIKVLRMRQGDDLDLTDGKGFFYKAKVRAADPRRCEFEVVQKIETPKKGFSIHIAIAPTKNMDRMEWFVEKAVEIGVDAISFMLCRNSERKAIKPGRLNKVAISAMKQSQRAWLPSLSAVLPFKSFLAGDSGQKFIAHVDSQNPHHLYQAAKKGGSYVVLIGPEGDFSLEELEEAKKHSYQKVSLGTNRLRTETAALTACQTLNLLNL